MCSTVHNQDLCTCCVHFCVHFFVCSMWFAVCSNTFHCAVYSFYLYVLTYELCLLLVLKENSEKTTFIKVVTVSVKCNWLNRPPWHCILHTVKFTLHTVHCTQCTVNCTLYLAYWALHTSYLTPYCTVHSARCETILYPAIHLVTVTDRHASFSNQSSSVPRIVLNCNIHCTAL